MSAPTAETMTVTHEQGATRRLAHMAARKSAPGVIGLLLLQHVVHVPAALAPVAAFLNLHVG